MVPRSYSVTHGATSLIVHSHLRWDFVWQRPQQLVSRFASSYPVLFVEEPVFDDDLPIGRQWLDTTAPARNVFRVVPHLPAQLRGRYDAAIETVRTLLRALVGRSGDLGWMYTNTVQWFFTPMPAPTMLGAFGERGVVYDCMDELSQFRFAPADLRERERALLDRADVVFTGGRRLWEAKRRHHPNVHCFGCGVDAAHFGRALDPKTRVPDDIAALPAPRCLYIGVIDERVDYPLLAALADALPNMSVVMIGPVVKVDPDELPRRPNIHWLGRRDYDQLPAYLKAADVALMPFALNEATEYINPTKTLEYMAAGRPIVSTPVPDVVRQSAPVVEIATSPGAFVRAVADAIRAPNSARIFEGRRRAEGVSWTTIVCQMQFLIDTALGVDLGQGGDARIPA
jgi:glycosyltransferase involved in cell wall biosynthesis